MRGCRLLYFVKSKNGTKCKNFAVLLCFYVNTFILLYFLRWQEGGATALLNPLLTYSTYTLAEAEKFSSHHGLNLPWLPCNQKKNFMDDTDKIMHNGGHFEIVCHAHQKTNLRWPYSQKTFL